MVVDFYSEPIRQDVDNIIKSDLNSEVVCRWLGVFDTCCSKINKTKIALSKDVISELKPILRSMVQNHDRGGFMGHTEALSYYGNTAECRYRLMELLGEAYRRDFYKYFQDALGTVRIDTEHTALFLDIMLNTKRLTKGTLLYATVQDLFYAYRVQDLIAELDTIEKYIKKVEVKGEKTMGLSPAIAKLRGVHTWNICPPVMYNYFPHFSIPSGDVLYYYAPDFLLSRILYSYLLQTPFSSVESIAEISDLLYIGATPKFENRLIPHAFKGRFKSFDGRLKKKILGYESTLGQTNLDSNSSILNLYTLEIAPRAEAMIGRYAGLIAEELNSVPGYSKDIAEIFFVNANLVALRVKPNVNINSLLPINGKYLKKAEQGSPWHLFYNEI